MESLFSHNQDDNHLNAAKRLIDLHISAVRQNPKILDLVNGENSREYQQSYDKIIKALNQIDNKNKKEDAINYLERKEDELENDLFPTENSGGKRKSHRTKKNASRKLVSRKVANKKRASNKKRGTQKRK